MNALVVSDLHYALPQFDWLVGRAARYDLIVIAGDLLDLASPVDVDTQIIVVSKYLERMRAESLLAVCSGNHDGDVRGGEGDFSAQWLRDLHEPGLAVDGDSVPLGGDRVTVCPWWESEESRKAMVAMLRAEAAVRKKWRRWIWVHHAPPAGCPVSWTGRDYSGDAFLRELILEFQPDVVFCGHIHNAPFYADGAWVAELGRTWIFNPGRQIGPIPAFIRLDLDALIADYRNLEEAERLDLTTGGTSNS